MTIEDGRFVRDSAEDILEVMVEDAKDYWGDDLNDNTINVVRQFYAPIAIRLAEAQRDIKLVLDSSQLEHADGTALDLLTALIGITRQSAGTATGQVTFSRGSDAPTDYTIAEGTTVQTDASDPIQFETTETVTLAEGTQEVTADVEAVEPGPESNVGPNTLTVMPDTPNGVSDVTNTNDTNGGTAAETDDELRARAKEELAEGSRASAPALVNSVKALDGVTNVSIFINDGQTDQIGSSDKGFEIVAAGGDSVEIAQTILNTKAAADTSHAGYNGSTVTETVDIGNGQTLDIAFSRPTEIQIYVDVSVETTDEYEGDDAVRDSIIEYIGGTFTSGNDASGLGAGDDVLYGEIEYQIRDLDGVHDVTSLEVGTSADPTGTSNIAIANSEVAIADGTDDSITISTTSV